MADASCGGLGPRGGVEMELAHAPAAGIRGSGGLSACTCSACGPILELSAPEHLQIRGGRFPFSPGGRREVVGGAAHQGARDGRRGRCSRAWRGRGAGGRFSPPAGDARHGLHKTARNRTFACALHLYPLPKTGDMQMRIRILAGMFLTSVGPGLLSTATAGEPSSPPPSRQRPRSARAPASHAESGAASCTRAASRRPGAPPCVTRRPSSPPPDPNGGVVPSGPSGTFLSLLPPREVPSNLGPQLREGFLVGVRDPRGRSLACDSHVDFSARVWDCSAAGMEPRDASIASRSIFSPAHSQGYKFLNA
jgi:hypothetical protein